jgi:hypothetical protein
LVGHVLETDVAHVIMDQFSNVGRHLALHDAGQPFVDLLPIKLAGWEVVLKSINQFYWALFSSAPGPGSFCALKTTAKQLANSHDRIQRPSTLLQSGCIADFAEGKP